MEEKYSKELENINSEPIRAHIGKIIEIILAGLPCGGAFSTLISNYLPNYKQERIIKILNLFAKELNIIKDKLTDDYILKEQFSYYFEQCLKKSMDEYDDEKIKFYIGFLIGDIYFKETCKNANKDYYFKLIDQLTPLQLKLLRFFKNPESFLAENHIVIDINPKSQAQIHQIIKLAFKEIDDEILKKSITELATSGLIKRNEDLFSAHDPHNVGIIAVEKELTKLGFDFIQFCEGYKFDKK